MTKKQKMLLGVGAVAVVGYWLWKRQQSTTSFSGGVQSPRMRSATGIAPAPGTLISRVKSKTPAKLYGSSDCSGQRKDRRCTGECRKSGRLSFCTCEAGDFNHDADSNIYPFVILTYACQPDYGTDSTATKI
jgi:hypothetical protein